MSVLKSNLSVTSDIFVKNKNEMLSKIDEIKKVKDFAFKGGVKKFNKKTSKEKKLLPRMRITQLLDKDSTFLEIGALANAPISKKVESLSSNWVIRILGSNFFSLEVFLLNFLTPPLKAKSFTFLISSIFDSISFLFFTKISLVTDKFDFKTLILVSFWYFSSN